MKFLSFLAPGSKKSDVRSIKFGGGITGN